MSSSAVERACELLGSMLPAGSDATVDVLRQSYRDWCARFPLDPDVTVEPASLGGVPGLWVSVPESEPDRVILHLHGGAYAIGSAEGHRELTSRLARAARARMAVPHIWHHFGSFLPQARRSIAEIGEFVVSHGLSS